MLRVLRSAAEWVGQGDRYSDWWDKNGDCAAEDGETIGRATQCAVEECDGAPLPCATFCFRHVARCERQKLYTLGADGATRVRGSEC